MGKGCDLQKFRTEVNWLLSDLESALQMAIKFDTKLFIRFL